MSPCLCLLKQNVIYQRNRIELLGITNQLSPQFKEELDWHRHCLNLSHLGAQWRKYYSTKPNVNFKVHEQKYQLPEWHFEASKTGKWAITCYTGRAYSCLAAKVFFSSSRLSLFPFSQSKNILLISSSQSSNSSNPSDLFPFLSTSFFPP